MQVSYHLLKEYVDIEISPEQLANRLSLNGIVAEHSKPVLEQVRGVIVGKITEIEIYEKNQDLRICRVDLKHAEAEVLCGAKNMRVGDLIPFATEGAFLPDIGQITGKDIQGFYSRGMICSASELGLEKSKSPGVLILDNGFPVGEDLTLLPGIQDDVVFDFEIFSNRPDLLSIIGIAREISAFSGNPIRIPEVEPDESSNPIEKEISVRIKDWDLCPRYAGRIIKGLTVKDSPFWLRWKLFLLGIRPINNVVDVTNYVMMETGQPLHAFDLNFIQGQQIIIRKALPGEKFNTLDGVSRILTAKNLVIADRDRAIALAGVMGGENSEIKDHTTDVFLESAYFDPVNNRRTSRHFSLRTDASNRFEKGIDPEGQIFALNQAVNLIKATASGEILSGVIDERREKYDQSRSISLNMDKVERVIGTQRAGKAQFSQRKIMNILKRLQFGTKKQDDRNIRVTIPSFRGDIQRDVDLIEEIAKIYGYDRIPNTLFQSTVIQPTQNNQQKILEKIKNILIGCGMYQVINYSMISPAYFDWMKLPETHLFRNTIQLSNPLIQDQTVMRTTLIPGLLKTIQWNINHKVEKIKIFEIGRVFFPHGSQEQKNSKQLPIEKIMISGAIAKYNRGNIWEKEDEWDFYYLKGILESFFESLNIEAISYQPGCFPFFDQEQNGRILIGENEIGTIGKILPGVADFLGLSGDIYLFEIDFSQLYPEIKEDITFKLLPKYPSTQRDIAMVVKEKLPISEIKKAIWEVDYDIIQNVELFDIFRGKQILPGTKSLAFSIIFRAEDRTLTDNEVDKIMESVKIKLTKTFQATLRQ